MVGMDEILYRNKLTGGEGYCRPDQAALFGDLEPVEETAEVTPNGNTTDPEIVTPTGDNDTDPEGTE